MESLNSRVSYLNGLIEGLDIDKSTKEGRIITEIVSILKDMADEIKVLKSTQEDMEEYVDAMDDDLNKLENEFYDEDYDDYDEDFIDVKCPQCGETVYVDSDIIDDKDAITCPNCNHSIDLAQMDTCSCSE